jgi:hypothetical protein
MLLMTSIGCRPVTEFLQRRPIITISHVAHSDAVKNGSQSVEPSCFQLQDKKQKGFNIDPAQTDVRCQTNKHQTIIANLKPAENQRYPARCLKEKTWG